MGASVLGCSGGSGLPDAAVADAPPPTGRFSVGWTIADGDRVLSCDDVGALVMSVEVTSPSLGAGYVEAFTCGTGTGTSRFLPVGVYDLAFELIGRSGTLGIRPDQRLVVTEDDVVPAVALRYPVNAQGRVDGRLLAGATANCSAAGGAQITAMSLVMERQGGACVPTAFTIGAGATNPATTYMSTCAPTPPTTLCIERDQAITATIGSGPYVVRVRGAVGAAPCWSADQLADVPPVDRTLRVDVGLTYLKGTPGCP
jgi:hypothetical protein